MHQEITLKDVLDRWPELVAKIKAPPPPDYTSIPLDANPIIIDSYANMTETHINNPASSTARAEPQHVHGPWCAHEHGSQATVAHIEKVKYASMKDLPEYDLRATFATNDGPRWSPNPRKAAERIFNRIKAVPEGEVIVLFCNVEFYKWFALHIKRQLAPSTVNQMNLSGIMGMFGPKCVIVCDAPVGLELTEDKAYYFCTEVIHMPEEEGNDDQQGSDTATEGE